MTRKLTVSIGQYSNKGIKEINQDFHGATIPKQPLLTSKGIAIAIADGISSSDVSQIASEASVRGFLDDYSCTPESWSVKKSAAQVLTATNSWLYSQSQKSEHRFDNDRGYVCTLSAMVFKSTTAHIFHIGDSRIYRLRDNEITQLTEDHRLWINAHKSYLNRGLGISPFLEIDYDAKALEVGDTFILTTDGIYEFISEDEINSLIKLHHQALDIAAQVIAEVALANGSQDNLTIQIIRIDDLPLQSADEALQKLTEQPFPPILDARMNFDGYQILRALHHSSRSHVYLAMDIDNLEKVVIKTPSIDLQGDPAYLERFLMEEWIARRLNNAHILKPCPPTKQRNYLYVAMEYIEGITLSQWMLDNPQPAIETVRDIVEQIAKGLRAFHRQEMIHQDLRPENIMIDINGMVKIIDFGATKVAGLAEISSPIVHADILGTVQYTAPEYFVGEVITHMADNFSLAVITYQMLSGKLPFDGKMSQARTKAAQNRLVYQSVLDDERDIPAWIDDALKKALHPNPYKRYSELSEYLYDLRHPTQAFLNKTRAPLIEREPVKFWQGICAILSLIILLLIFR
ncbi:bifunctional protein-serine/threonine kinase/phosphatase [Shewanella sp. 5_MG-2023]|uniref:bifunctional protein-serine/threonine kinase/phosphatase n=1 Tax=unclassified Shewanella TaxID=196818 RepID=UPI0026E3D4E0|nr:MULTISPECIES: bifunctional protein-serine/threonine kinase/phosphatase [unclassified Shewanella]MDO6638947.1 bifunctional protein-serine/threonine kinase/phosphatase [Shewanella sp. 5_MG-2023]MDO6774021.1 bifunctional protein-serine/threonine kinase/phosphatase [Shewanella sp. 3_MG-2023]